MRININSLTKEIPTGVEIGVLYGEFSRMILDEVNPSLLYLVDPFDINKVIYNEGMEFMPTAFSTDDQFVRLNYIFEHEIESEIVVVIKKYSFDAVVYFQDGFFDFIYHDASHLYEDIKRDLSDWLPKLKKGGLMCGHDYIQHESFGVIQAVDEFIKEHNFEMIILNENGGDFALKAV